MQLIEGFVVNFVKCPGWFLEPGHPLGRDSLTSELYPSVSAAKAKNLRSRHPLMNWEGLDPDFKPVWAFNEMGAGVKVFRCWLTRAEKLQKLNRGLMRNGHRSKSASEIV